VIYDRLHATNDFFKTKSAKKSQKCQKMQINGKKLEKSVKKGGGG
jgi:hypothetical protein